ncbi:MAG: hypothetical protein KDG51_20795, partial [Calditrichaeota bacterium]|nr:hypothetical protein [Calditrichota bacterium]
MDFCRQFGSILFITTLFFVSYTTSLTAQVPTQRSVAFEGTGDFVNMGSNPSLEVSQAITMEAWIYPSWEGATSYGGIII